MIRVRAWVRESSVPYLSVVVIATLLARYMPYLVRQDVTIKGQPLQIAVELILFPVAVVLWALYRGRATSSTWLRVFLISMIVAWAVRMGLMFAHGDQFNHLVWLTPVFLVMLLLKTPSWSDAWTAIVVLGGVLAVLLTLSYVLEVTHIVEPMYVPQDIIDFQEKEYWLPLNNLVGVEGRWTGPFGHNTRAGFAAAMVLVIALGRWRPKTSIPLAVVGVFFLLLASVRASYLAALTGILIVVLFSRRGVMAKVPGWLRWTALGAAAVLAGLMFTFTGAGLTGRQTIWPTFWGLIPQNPFIGIGATGIDKAGGLAQLRMDAHNILLDELVRFGIVGFVVMIGALAIGTVIAFRAANRGFSAPAAVLSAYLITSMTDLQNDWLQLYYHSVLIVVSVVAAGQWVSESGEATDDPVQGLPEAVPL